jgi:4-amino-4-deoxy-L-arabinose transferase-like glycosyltransferase
VELAGCAALLAAAAWFLFADLGRCAFHDGDEALYASISMEMQRSGDWLTPRYWGEPFLHKPPLQYWLMAISRAVIPGTSEFQARFPSAAAALVTIALVYWAARRLSGPLAGATAALIMLTNVQFVYEHAARSANLDSLVTLLTFASLVCGVNGRESRKNRIASAVCLSGVMLLKAPIALFPIAVVLTHLMTKDRRAAWSWLRWLAGSVVVLVLPWHIYELVTQGRTFWDAYVAYEILGRGGEAVTDYPGARFLHLQAFWHSFLPWSPFIIGAVIMVLAGVPRTKGEARGPMSGWNERDGLRPLAWYALLFAVVLSLVPSKWPWYGLPAYPAIAVVFAVTLRRAYDARRFIALPVGLAGMSAVRILLFDLNPLYTPAGRRSYLWPGKTSFLWTADHWPHWNEFLAAVGILAAGALVPLLWRTRRVAGPAAVAGALCAFVVTGVTISSVPRRYESSAQKLVLELEHRRTEEVFLFGFTHVPWYGNRMEPIASAYFLGLTNSVVTDCGEDAGCVTPSPGKRSSVVVYAKTLDRPDKRDALGKRLRDLGVFCDVWSLQPDEADGYKLVSRRGAK